MDDIIIKRESIKVEDSDYIRSENSTQYSDNEYNYLESAYV